MCAWDLIQSSDLCAVASQPSQASITSDTANTLSFTENATTHPTISLRSIPKSPHQYLLLHLHSCHSYLMFPLPNPFQLTPMSLAAQLITLTHPHRPLFITMIWKTQINVESPQFQCGLTDRKTEYTTRLVDSLDLLCLTETWRTTSVSTQSIFSATVALSTSVHQ